MIRVPALFLVAALLGCAAAPPPAGETDFAAALLARLTPAPDAMAPRAGPPLREPEPKPVDTLEVPPALGRLAADEAALDGFLATPFGESDLAALAVLRSAEVEAARAELEAVRTGYRQAEDLDDLAGLYRAWSRDLDTRVGPQRHRVPAAAIAPSPNVTALSGEIVDLSVELAREQLRSVELSVAADARRAHAAVARWAEATRIVGEDLRLMEGLLSVMRSRWESGQADQAGYLTFSATVARRRTDLDVLGEQAHAHRARLNRLLGRPDGAGISLDLVPEPVEPSPHVPVAVVERALAESPALRTAVLRAERASVAVRMAETMTLPRFDVGSARYERGRTGEAGVDRGPVFPDPGRMIMPRSDFGVREAQVKEMRARAGALAARAEDSRLRTAEAVRNGLFAVASAERRLDTLVNRVVPPAERALRAARGAYEGGRSGYLDLLEAARRLLKARLDAAVAAEDLSVARANLLEAAGFDPRKEMD